MNVGQMLVELGFKPRLPKIGFPAPAVIMSRDPGPVEGMGMLETKDEIESYIDTRKSVAERATTKRSAGNWF